MKIAAVSLYWIIVAIWFIVLAVALHFYSKNPALLGPSRLLIIVVIVDTLRDIFENIYFGVYFGGQYGFFATSVVTLLGQPLHLMIPKIANAAAGCIVLFILLLHWLPSAARERDRLDRLASVDGMTGLANRRHFLSLMAVECERSVRYARPLAMLMLDIDHFKSINDRYGHDVGDKAIIALASVCKDLARDTDIPARLGGEEFGILLPETTSEAAAVLAERLRNAIAAIRVPVGDDSLSFTTSIGVSEWTADTDVDKFVKQADMALYDAKRGGRNRVCCFAPI